MLRLKLLLSQEDFNQFNNSKILQVKIGAYLGHSIEFPISFTSPRSEFIQIPQVKTK